MFPAEASIVVLTGIIIAGVVVAGWALLRIVGAERDYRLRLAEQQRLLEVQRQLAAQRRQMAIEAGRSGTSSGARRAA
jgi:hypothetical protein